jgi:hypothetical protein
MGIDRVKSKSVLAVLLCAFSGILITLVLLSVRKPSLSEQLSEEIALRIPPSATRTQVDAWLATQPQEYTVVSPSIFDRYLTLFFPLHTVEGQYPEDFAGVNRADVGYYLLGEYSDMPDTIQVFLFFDKHERLIKSLVYRYRRDL